MKAFKPLLIASLVAGGVLFAGAASADEALAKKAGCLKCHAIDKKKMGPSFKDAVAKYKGQKDADAAIVAKLKAGGKEHPAVQASDADLAAVAKWILTL